MQFNYFLPVSCFLQLGHFIATSFKENLLWLKIDTEDIESFKTSLCTLHVFYMNYIQELLFLKPYGKEG